MDSTPGQRLETMTPERYRLPTLAEVKASTLTQAIKKARQLAADYGAEFSVDEMKRYFKT